MKTDEDLEAVLRIFALYGFRKASMSDIASAVGISRQALYNRYASKEAVFGWAATQLVMQSATGALAALDKPDSALPDRLLAAYDCWAGRHVDLLRTSPHATEIIAMAHSETSERTDRAEQDINTKVAKLISANGQGTSKARAADLAHALYWASKGLLYTARDNGAYREGLSRVIAALLPV